MSKNSTTVDISDVNDKLDLIRSEHADPKKLYTVFGLYGKHEIKLEDLTLKKILELDRKGFLDALKNEGYVSERHFNSIIIQLNKIENYNKKGKLNIASSTKQINQAVKKYYDRKENTYEFKNDFENLSKDKKEIVNRIGKLEPVIQKLKNKDNKDAYRALEIIEKLDNKMKLSDYENSLLNKYSQPELRKLVDFYKSDKKIVSDFRSTFMPYKRFNITDENYKPKKNKYEGYEKQIDKRNEILKKIYGTSEKENSYPILADFNLDEIVFY